MIQENQNLIFKSNNELSLYQRSSDGYVNATALCKESGKLIADYLRNDTTKEFLKELEADTRIPITELIQIVRGGTPGFQGTWAHPKVAINLAQWLSPKFAVFVTNIMMDWFSKSGERRKSKEEELFAIIQEDKESFERTSAAAKIMKQRQVSKPIFRKKITQLNSELQLDLFSNCLTR